MRRSVILVLNSVNALNSHVCPSMSRVNRDGKNISKEMFCFRAWIFACPLGQLQQWRSTKHHFLSLNVRMVNLKKKKRKDNQEHLNVYKVSKNRLEIQIASQLSQSCFQFFFPSFLKVSVGFWQGLEAGANYNGKTVLYSYHS